MTERELESIISTYKADIAGELVRVLKERGLKITFAESCTGGLLSSGIVSVPGASEVFYGSIVSYDNSIKESCLGVSRDILESVGAVSDECARQMAFGVRKVMKSDIAVSATGIAGPGGGSEEKPVGTVFLGFSSREKTIGIRTFSEGDRQQIRDLTCLKAYALVLYMLENEEAF